MNSTQTSSSSAVDLALAMRCCIISCR
jgi:hypothetical protein